MSILKVDTINEKTSGNGVQIAGHVVQVVRNSITGTVATSSTSYVASGLGLTITPKFSTSKLFISVNVGRPSIQNNGRQLDFKLYEGSSAVDSNRLGSLYHNAGSGVAIYYGSTSYNIYLDASNTNARTYNLYYKAFGGSVNISDSSDIESAMIVMEIAQ